MADQDTLPLMIELSEGERETGKRDVCLCHIDCATVIMIGHEAVGHEVVGHEAVGHEAVGHEVAFVVIVVEPRFMLKSRCANRSLLKAVPKPLV